MHILITTIGASNHQAVCDDLDMDSLTKRLNEHVKKVGPFVVFKAPVSKQSVPFLVNLNNVFIGELER